MRWFFLFVLAFLISCEEREKKEGYTQVSVKELVGMRGCPHCHDMRRKLLGPSFYDISKRYTEKDVDKLVRSILEGSSGRWGSVPMPPQKLSEEEAKAIARWIISLKESAKDR
ncbi:MAG: c-type cytochrome [Aquificae bacterium]|nr:c-type cytochrome [Aquificota bacterium]